MTDKTPTPDVWSKPLDRRQMLKALGVVGSVIALSGPRELAHAMAQRQAGVEAVPEPPASGPSLATGEIPKRALGKTGVQVSALCFGGAHWGRMSSEAEATRLLHEALEAGVTFLDNAWEYHGGRSEEWMGNALQGRRQQAFLMTKVCSHGRDKRVAMHQLEESLRRLHTDYVDLWQIHEVIYDDDPDRHFAPGGAAEVDGCLVTLRTTRLRKEHRDESRELNALDRDDQTERLLKLMRLGQDMDAPHRDVTH